MLRLVSSSLLVLCVLVPAQGQSFPEYGDVVINEISYAPSPSSNEFIELYNRSEQPISLDRLSYADANRDFSPVTSADLTLAPDEYVVLARDTAAFRSAFPTRSPLAPEGWAGLNNGGDTVILRQASSGTVIDSVPYESDWGGSDGRSLERINPAASSESPSNWASSTAEAGATPGAQNSQFETDETPPSPLFAEQIGDRTIAVVFSEPLAPSSVSTTAFQLPSTPTTDVRQPTDSTVHLSLTAPPTDPHVTVQGITDRIGNRLEHGTVPLAHRPEEGEIALNEIMFDPRADDYDDRPDQVEYLELVNLTDRHLTLHGLRLTDRPTEEGVADTVRAGRRTALSPHGYGIVAAAPDGRHRASASPLSSAFPRSPLGADSVAFLAVDAHRLGLDNDGDLVRLHRADRTAVAEVSYRPDWHSAGLEDTKGTALARISPTGAAQSSDNWTSSTAAAGGTPGSRNEVSLSPPPEKAEAGLRIEPSPFSIERNGATRIQYTLDDVPNLVRAQIYDARGRKVRTLEEARLVGRTGELLWNGRDDDGNRVRVGLYVVLLEAVQTDAGTIATYKAPVVLARSLD